MHVLETGGQCFTSDFHSVALLFKDERGLAEHPLSCHPQGVFGSRESERKGEKMREKGKSEKTLNFSTNFIDKLKNLWFMSLTELI